MRNRPPHAWLSILALLPTLALAGQVAPPQMPNPFYAMDTALRDPAPLEEKLDQLKSLGYAGLCWTGTDVASTAAAISASEQRGLKVFALYVPFPLSSNRLEVPQNLDAVCGALAGHGTLIWAHIQSKAFKPSDPAGDSLAVPALRGAADIAAKHGVRIAIYPHHNFWAQRVSDAMRVAGAVDRPNFGVGFNLCHAIKVGDEARIPELLLEAKPRLFMVTVNGADSGDPSLGWDRLIQPLDKGTFDIAAFLKQIRAIGYDGPIGFQAYGIKEHRNEVLPRTMDAWRRFSAQATAAR